VCVVIMLVGSERDGVDAGGIYGLTKQPRRREMLLNPPPNPLPISMPLLHSPYKKKDRKKEKNGDKRGGSSPSSPNPGRRTISELDTA